MSVVSWPAMPHAALARRPDQAIKYSAFARAIGAIGALFALNQTIVSVRRKTKPERVAGSTTNAVKQEMS
jgi:hypothetical protein